MLYFGVSPIREWVCGGAVPSPEFFLTYEWKMVHFCAFWLLFFDVNLFLMIKNFTSKVAYHVKFLPTSLGGDRPHRSPSKSVLALAPFDFGTRYNSDTAVTHIWVLYSL